MIRLLYITNGISGPGGLERVLSIKASYLAEKLDYEVHILTLNQGASELFYEFSPRILYHDVQVIGNPINYLLHYIRGIRRVVKTVKPDVISVCDDGLKGFLLPILLRKPCPMIYERHASVQLNFGGIKNSRLTTVKNRIVYSIMNFGGRRFDAFIVLTNGNLNEWHTGNEKVIPNPVPFKVTQNSLLINKKVIAVGSHSYNKGYDLLIEAWKIIVGKLPEWKLEVYGKNDADLTFVRMASQSNLEGSISFHDPVQDIQGRYLDSSIMVLPSRSEGFGMVLIEAMSCGLPCVSFDCPHGPADIITDGVDGYLIENGNIQKLAEKLMILMNDQQLRLEMGQNAKRNVVRYLPDNVIPMWDELFKSLICKKND